MAELLGSRKRGRKKEGLRLKVAELVAELKATGEHEVTIDFGEYENDKGKMVADTATTTIPKSKAVVPFDLTSAKSEENVRQQIRNGIADALDGGYAPPKGKRVVVESERVALGSGEEDVVWFVALDAE